MEYHQLGSSSLQVSEIGLGCMSLPASDPATALAIIDRALELGINFFDTADLYDKGENELLVGKALRHKRDQVIIATKVGNQWRPDGSGWDWNPTKAYIISAVEKSLRRLQTDYIDLYQLHGGTIDDPIDETIEAFEQLQQEGKIRFYGISSIRPNVIRAYVSRANIVSVMLQYSLADRRPEETVVELLAKNKIGVLSRGALAQGMLAGKPPKEYLGHATADLQQAADMVNSIAKDNKSAAAVGTAFVLTNAAVTSAIIGCSSVKQLEEVALLQPELSEDDYKKLQQQLPAKFYEQHR
ncbi:MAG: aldo/keto reductase [Ferruginibacter sp.]|nr:aldo/keto reductase [Ferruginibacter sp.]